MLFVFVHPSPTAQNPSANFTQIRLSHQEAKGLTRPVAWNSSLYQLHRRSPYRKLLWEFNFYQTPEKSIQSFPKHLLMHKLEAGLTLFRTPEDPPEKREPWEVRFPWIGCPGLLPLVLHRGCHHHKTANLTLISRMTGIPVPHGQKQPPTLWDQHPKISSSTTWQHQPRLGPRTA